MDINDVYEPAEDTFTLSDVILFDISKISQNTIILELGCGSGYISDQIHKKNNKYFIISTDINKKALYATNNKNKIRCNLLDNINQKYIDCVIFNPPYLETYDSCAIYDGRKYGREIIDEFVDKLDVKLVYLLVIRFNRPSEVIENLNNKGYKVEVMKERKIQGETIIILKCIK
ncbi:N6 adenine specific DNA methylase [Spraguea lophii 42_110]|uniref:N6 adenine specific DNA methylase n=1 Tax=Spraguea lophii (strain 42_110) TaxID=1358809 RepID=S7XRA4_SPRLO|nr:N6 adenine specific DNA methylase [Spraguea lophii 42_110]